MAVRLELDQASLTDNDIARQVEFTAELDGDERDFAVKYSVLKELSGDEPDSDALELSNASATKLLMCASMLLCNDPPRVSSALTRAIWNKPRGFSAVPTSVPTTSERPITFNDHLLQRVVSADGEALRH